MQPCASSSLSAISSFQCNHLKLPYDVKYPKVPLQIQMKSYKLFEIDIVKFDFLYNVTFSFNRCPLPSGKTISKKIPSNKKVNQITNYDSSYRDKILKVIPVVFGEFGEFLFYLHANGN